MKKISAIILFSICCSLASIGQVKTSDLKGTWSVLGIGKTGKDTVLTYVADAGLKKNFNTKTFYTVDQFSADNPDNNGQFAVMMIRIMQNSIMEFDGSNIYAFGTLKPGTTKADQIKKGTYKIKNGILETNIKGKKKYSMSMVGDYLVLTSKDKTGTIFYLKKISDTLY
ncbi:MAG: hypothetical protein H7321_10490 [Bacteroidia bacterium]|nr:hypothetical protein [Bacteroidia bacterium]